MAAPARAERGAGAAPGVPEGRAPNLLPPPGNPRFPAFDGLRAIAALSVFLGHTVTQTLPLAGHRNLLLWAAQLSSQGVVIFFVISGFLLYRPFLVARRRGGPVNLGRYALKRVARIVPAYWVALSLLVLAGWVQGVTATNWVVFYAFGQIYSSHTISGGIPAAWTLCTEITFYISLPVLAWLGARGAGARRGGRAASGERGVRRALRGDLILLGVLSLGTIAFRLHFNSFFDYAILTTLPGTFLWFALGMALAVLSVAAEDSPRLRSALAVSPAAAWLSWVAAIGLFFLIGELARSASSAPIADFLVGGLVAVLIVAPGITGGNGPARLLRTRALGWIGMVSYSFYLIHSAVITQLAAHLGSLSFGWRYVVVLPGATILSCLCAAIGYYAIERPALRWARG